MIQLAQVFEIIATVASGLFTGAATYINLVEHPARMACGTRLAATEFGPSYHRAAVMQASLAVIGFLAATTAWSTGSGGWWLVGAAFLVSVIPFTLIAVMPTNKKLLDRDLDKESEFASRLLTKWNRLHAVRTLLALISFVVFVVTGR
jgi:uncharacterized membrane protein